MMLQHHREIREELNSIKLAITLLQNNWESARMMLLEGFHFERSICELSQGTIWSQTRQHPSQTSTKRGTKNMSQMALARLRTPDPGVLFAGMNRSRYASQVSKFMLALHDRGIAITDNEWSSMAGQMTLRELRDRKESKLRTERQALVMCFARAQRIAAKVPQMIEYGPGTSDATMCCMSRMPPDLVRSIAEAVHLDDDWRPDSMRLLHEGTHWQM